MLNLWKNYKIEDLNSIRKSLINDRTEIQIAVIDDNTFPPLEELRRHRFNITFFNDIERINTLSDFEIIITDIKGVGKHLGSNLEGAHLIEEIHRHYPNKYLIAYSASRFDMSLSKYFSLCDEQKKKDTDVSEWTTTLDRAISCIKDPVFQWEKTRQILIGQKFPTDYINKLEKAYTKSVLKKNPNYLNKEIKAIQSIWDKPVVKFATESIFKFTSNFILELIK